VRKTTLEIDKALELLRYTKARVVDVHPFLKEWELSFDKAKRRAGVCRITDKQIGISIWHVRQNESSTVLDTLLHELAHAIAYELYNEKGHGIHWKRVAADLGATPKATGEFNLPEAPWTLVNYCSIEEIIERIAPRYRRNKNIRKYAIKGRPNTKGCLYYLNSEELAQFELGYIEIEQLNFIQ